MLSGGPRGRDAAGTARKGAAAAGADGHRQTRTLAILQSGYIPWKGYFDIIAAVDEFVVFDEAQYTRRDWRNRNRIVSNGEVRWLTVPVASKGRFRAPIEDIRIADRSWAERHWTTLCHAYARAPHFPRYKPALAAAYERAGRLDLLTEVNVLLLETVCRILDISTRLTRADTVQRRATSATERLLEICAARDATAYVSGPAGRRYIVRDRFRETGIDLFYADYSGYPAYAQRTKAFDHQVSILDTLFRCGPATREHLKSIGRHDSFLRPE